MGFAKKSLGQHFLRDRGILAKIADAAKLALSDTVLEVGPGEGTLTELLLQSAGRVVAVEKDDRLIPLLREKFSAEIEAERLELIHADILSFNTKRSTLNAKRWKVVANLPYYITGQFLRKFLEENPCLPHVMVLLLQKEVAKRIVASDGRESILSISVKCYGTPRYLGTVKAGSFSPPPKVDSAILAIENISKDFFRGEPSDSGRFNLTERENQFFTVLKKGFSHPRKLLSSNLELTGTDLEQCGVPSNARAENLSLEQWKCLTKKIL